jgi:hypothetical protein
MFKGYFCPQGLESLEVQVDRTGSDGAASRQGYPRLTETGQERSEYENGSAHGLDQIIGGLMATESGGIDPNNIPVAQDLRAKVLQNLDGGIYVPQERYVAYFMAPGSQDGRYENGKSGIF